MRKLLAIAALSTLAFASPTGATTIADPSGDFLPTFAGTHDADLDVLSFSVDYDEVATQFLLGAVLGGPIDPALPGVYVIGVNTGAGAIAPFADVGAPNVRFDQVIALQKDGTAFVTGPSGGALDPALVTLVGNIFTLRVPLAFLASTGFAPENYGFNLWPRNGVGGDNSQIADFAPDDGTIRSAIPEPAAWAMMIAGFTLIGTRFRKRTPRLLA